MKTAFYQSLLTPTGIGKKTLPFLMVGVFFVSCTRDLLYVDDLLAPVSGDELLVFKYEGETTSYREYIGTANDLNISRTIPDVKRSKFELRISKSGDVEIFTEHLTPSEDFFDMPSESQLGEVKYEHLVMNQMKLYDADRNLIGEFDASQITSHYTELYNDLLESGEKNVSFLNVMDLNIEKFKEASVASNLRGIDLKNAYDDHPDYEVFRSSSFSESIQAEVINEVIIHKNSRRVLFVSGYTGDGTAISRSQFGYEDDKLSALLESRLDFSDPNEPYKQVTNTKFDNFEFNINLD